MYIFSGVRRKNTRPSVFMPYPLFSLSPPLVNVPANVCSVCIAVAEGNPATVTKLGPLKAVRHSYKMPFIAIIKGFVLLVSNL